MNRVPLRRRLVQGAFWSVIGSVAARLLSVPTSVALARLMGSVHYGELAIIQSSADLFALFAGFGLSLTATKHVAELRGKDPHRTGRILALSTLTACVTGIVMAGALFVLAPWLAKQTLAAPSLVGPLRIGACLLFFSSLSGAQCGALYGFEAFRTTAGLQAIIGVLNVPLMVGGYLVSGLNGILWGMVVGRFLEWLLRHLAVRAETSNANIAVCYRDCAREIPILWKFSLPALISGALVVPINWGCSAILVNQLNGYAEMGIYNAASQWYNALLFVPSTLGTVLLPLLSDRMGEDDRRGAVGALRFMLRFNLALMLPSVVGISLVSPYIMRMYGREYANAWPTLIVVVVTAGLFAVLMPIGDVIAASDRMWLGCLMNAGWALVLVPSTMLLVHGGWGSLGLASARLFAYSVHAVWTSLFAYKALQLAQQRTDVDDLHLVAQPTV